MRGAALRWLAGASVILTSAVAARSARAEQRPHDDDALELVHLLEYVASDYPAAVRDGKVVNDAEYREQLAMLDRAARIVARLARATPSAVAFPARLGSVRDAAAGKEPSARVAGAAASLRAASIAAFRLDLAPHETPQLDRGKALYLANCAPCHGLRGRADTAVARDLNPPPVSFVDGTVAEALSPARVAAIVRFGIAGTAMASFPTLDEAQRWDLGFYVMTLRHTPRSARRTPRFALAELALLRDGDLLDDLHAAGAAPHELGNLLAELRTRAPYGAAPGAFERTRARLFEASQALSWGDRSAARARVAEAQLDGVRALRGAFLLADGGVLGADVGERALLLRERLAGDERAEPLLRDLEVLQRELARVQIMAAGPPPAPGWSVVDAPTAVPPERAAEAGARGALRMGLVPALACAALAAAARSSRRTNALERWAPAVLGAAMAGAICLFLPLEGKVGAVVEGSAALLVCAALLADLGSAASEAGSRARSFASAAFLATFVAVWLAPAVEVAAFARSLSGDAARAGVLSAGAVLVALSVLSATVARSIARRGVRWQLALAALAGAAAVALAGRAVFSFQIAGVVPARVLGWIGAPWFGVFPTREACAAQALVLALVAVAVHGRQRSGDATSPT